ncbi:D-serine ammonia-lyase [Bacillus sp. AGMB 02131]|uniref:Probable D-serine dehydratase n=1 Tax=Peribacillus faecalis TaxID=2772559 RepID=A0A927CZB5_9BACI|nr:D-serine ammonia-lyase [Peribacillus faecalis]MBD3110463.1 D-serine ammonia-lyase [Peribacillus faecalis]
MEGWLEQFPLMQDMTDEKPVFWVNPDYEADFVFQLDDELLRQASERFYRFQPVLKSIFGEIASFEGIIESPITDISKMKIRLETVYETTVKGNVLLKRDDLLPIAGSIKARGGFHEVLAFAEKLAREHGLLTDGESDYSCILSEEARQLFNQYHIVVGSTGNLGLSIGMIGSSLGFRVSVHMSHDAKQWKKDLLRKNGVTVVEHLSDYSVAVEQARAICSADEKSYFVDDENSLLLFAGYAVAALELKRQLADLNIDVNCNNPLYVYLPCGVGGGPGGITYGLKKVFGKHVHCYFAEPLQSPSMLLGLMTKQHDSISVYDIGLTNQTEADGLAVGRPSKFVGKLLKKMLAGIYTVSDYELLQLMKTLNETEEIFLEPSALAGTKGPCVTGKEGIHLVWATGGSIIPNNVKKQYLQKAKEL